MTYKKPTKYKFLKPNFLNQIEPIFTVKYSETNKGVKTHVKNIFLGFNKSEKLGIFLSLEGFLWVSTFLLYKMWIGDTDNM